MTQDYDGFRAELLALFDEPIEDGVAHPAEYVIEDALLANKWRCFAWLSRAIEEYARTRSSTVASIVRCIGRLRRDDVGTWGMHVVEDALRHKDVEVREAGIRALEAWGGHVAFHMLCDYAIDARHDEPWLADYVLQVIGDMSTKLAEGGGG